MTFVSRVQCFNHCNASNQKDTNVNLQNFVSLLPGAFE